MNRWLAAFTCIILANTAWGQSPSAPGIPSVNPSVQACQEPACPQALKTVCVPEPSIKVKVSIQYFSTCDKVCPGGCSFPLFGKCQPCEGANCGSPYTKKYLVKKIVTAEEPTVKCVPVLVPACEARGILHHNQPGLYAPATSAQPGSIAPPTETIPVPPVPMKK